MCLTCLIRALPQRSKRDTSVQRSETLLFDHEICSMCCVAVFGYVERVGHGVVLRLQSDLDHFHWRHDGYGFGHTGGEASCWGCGS